MTLPRDVTLRLASPPDMGRLAPYYVACANDAPLWGYPPGEVLLERVEVGKNLLPDQHGVVRAEWLLKLRFSRVPSPARDVVDSAGRPLYARADLCGLLHNPPVWGPHWMGMRWRLSAAERRELEESARDAYRGVPDAPLVIDGWRYTTVSAAPREMEFLG